ncbi:MAG: PEP/pyruvate-binding domain-containing protein [Christensenellales bacterium]
MKLLKKEYIDIDLLSKYYAIGMLDEFKQYIGGKAYGLAILNCFRTIPKTIVISHYMEDYNLSTFINKNKTYAIRSSADCEDNVNHSFAGMFNSVLNVSPKEIDVAIKNVKESINENRVQEYIKQFNLNKPHMNIVVQEFINPDYAGVWLSNSLESGVYELVKGVGEQLVSGSVTPTIHNFDKNDKLSCFFVKLQNEIGSNCDFEFCILNNEIIMLQCRPVTTDIKEDIVINDGIGASYGEVEGEIQFIDNPSKINEFEANKILVTYATDPNWIPAIMKSKGIITSFGGYLCHTSIISRELNKPCVVGINKSLFEKIIKSKRVKMNGFTGEIQILE